MIIYGYNIKHVLLFTQLYLLTHNYICSVPSLVIGYTDNHVHMHTAICVTQLISRSCDDISYHIFVSNSKRKGRIKGLSCSKRIFFRVTNLYSNKPEPMHSPSTGGSYDKYKQVSKQADKIQVNFKFEFKIQIQIFKIQISNSNSNTGEF